MYDLELIKAFSKLIVEEIDPDKIILFGSYAYGIPSDESDVDFLVIKNVQGQDEFSIEEEAKLNSKILNRKRQEGFPVQGDIFLMTSKQAEEIASLGDGAIADAFRKGILLYENAV